MALQYKDVEAVSREVVREYRQQSGLEFVGATSAHSGERVEVMVTVAGCHKAPCLLMLNLSRHDRLVFADDLRQKLQEALHSHMATPV